MIPLLQEFLPATMKTLYRNHRTTFHGKCGKIMRPFPQRIYVEPFLWILKE